MSDTKDDYTSYSNNLRARLARFFNRKVDAPREASDKDFARRPWLLSQEQTATVMAVIAFGVFVGLPVCYGIKQNWGRDVAETCGGLTRLRTPGTFKDTWVVERLEGGGEYFGWDVIGEFLREKEARAYCRRLRERGR